MSIALIGLRNDLRRLETFTMASLHPIKANETPFKDYLLISLTHKQFLKHSYIRTFVGGPHDFLPNSVGLRTRVPASLSALRG